MGLLGKTKNHRYFLALDFGSSSVKALIFERPKNGDALKVIGAGAVTQNRSDMRLGVVTSIEGVVSSAKAAIDEAKKDCGVKPKQVVVGISGRLVGGISTTLRLSRENSGQPVSEEELKTLATSIKEAALGEASKAASELTGDAEIEVKIIESYLTATKVDGYYSHDLIGLTGRILEPSVFTSFCSRSHLENLYSVFKKLKLKPTAVVSNLSAITHLVRGKEPFELNTLVFDVGGGTTDVAIVFGGGIVATRTISFGGLDFTQAIASEFNLPFEEAEEKKIKFSLGEIGGEKGAQIRGALKPAVERWCSGIEVALADFDAVKTFPGRIILTGGGSALPDLREAILARPWTRDFPFLTFPRVDHLEVSVLRGKLVDDTSKLVEEADVVPASLGLIGGRLFGKEDNASYYFRI